MKGTRILCRAQIGYPMPLRASTIMSAPNTGKCSNRKAGQDIRESRGRVIADACLAERILPAYAQSLKCMERRPDGDGCPCTFGSDRRFGVLVHIGYGSGQLVHTQGDSALADAQ